MEKLNMKKLSIVLLTLVFLAGCAGISINDANTKLLLVKSSARVLGYKMVANNPSTIEPIKVFCNQIITNGASDLLVNLAKSFLVDQFKRDPLLMASLQDLTMLVEVKQPIPTEPKYDQALIRAAAIGFLDGVTIFEAQSL